MTRRRLAIYVSSVAAYEALLSASYAWLTVTLPITLDPRLPINWVCARYLDRLSSPLVIVLLVSCAWHSISAAGLLRSRNMTPVFAIGETILSIPGLILYGSVLLGFSGHVFAGSVVVVGSLVFVVCSLVPIAIAYNLMLG